MPGALHRAGFEVTLLAPPGAFAAHSRHIAQSRLLPENATAQEWLFALIAAIEATAPTILLPGDEMSLRLMQAIVCEPLPGPQPEAIKDLSALIVRSLGAPQFYEAAMDKALLQPLMQAAGIRVPDFTVARGPEEAAEAARGLRSQVIVKPSKGSGRRELIDCDTRKLRLRAFLRVLEGAEGVRDGAGVSVLIQRRSTV
jgi:biotin carboxylase